MKTIQKIIFVFLTFSFFTNCDKNTPKPQPLGPYEFSFENNSTQSLEDFVIYYFDKQLIEDFGKYEDENGDIRYDPSVDTTSNMEIIWYEKDLTVTPGTLIDDLSSPVQHIKFALSKIKGGQIYVTPVFYKLELESKRDIIFVDSTEITNGIDTIALSSLDTINYKSAHKKLDLLNNIVEQMMKIEHKAFNNFDN